MCEPRMLDGQMNDNELHHAVGEYLKDKPYVKPKQLALKFGISQMKAIATLKRWWWEKGVGRNYVPP